MNIVRNAATLFALVLLGEAVQAQCQTQKLLASDASAGSMFGNDVAISGDWAVASSPFDGEVVNNSGAIYVFQRQGTTWVQVQKLKANDPTDGSGFGWSVAIDGDLIVVGAFNDAGSAYVFERSGLTWSQTAKLVASDANSGDNFGYDVAVSGTRVLVGALDDSDIWLFAGSAYVFERVLGTWTQVTKLTANDTAFGDQFGHSVAIDGDYALVGALGDDRPEGDELGAAYVFEHGTLGWTQVQKLISVGAAYQDYFGVSVAVSGSTALVGALRDSTGGNHAGAAYLFDRQPSGWLLTQVLTAADPGSEEYFGGSVALRGDSALISSHTDGAEGVNAGSAYAFRRTGSSWAQTGKLLANDAAVNDLFGVGVGIEGDTAFVGSNYNDGGCSPPGDCNAGAAYVFKLPPTAVQYGFCASGAPCNNRDTDGGCRNSTNQGAIFTACGSGSVTTDDLQLQARHCPPNKLTLLFMGPGQSTTIYGDGIRVASALNGVGVYRFGGLAADALGMAMRGPGLVAQSQTFPQTAGHIQPGSTWNFQIWYRDPQGPCHSGTNFSNGVQVAFGP